jgi:hypothetical protein
VTAAALHWRHKEELHCCFSFKARAQQGEAMQHLKLERKYGVVRFTGNLHHNRDHKLVFQSDDPVEAMQYLDSACAASNVKYGYMLVIKTDSQ